MDTVLNNFDQILLYIRGLTIALAALPWQWIITLLSCSYLVTQLLTVAEDNSYGRLHWQGLTRQAVLILVNGFIAIFLLDIGIKLIEVSGHNVPLWLSMALLIIPALGTIILIWWKLKDRETFTIKRFMDWVVTPLIAVSVPLVGSWVPSLWRGIESLY